jgi:hypothetical protein
VTWLGHGATSSKSVASVSRTKGRQHGGSDLGRFGRPMGGLWDSVGHYTTLRRKKSIGREDSFDVHGTTAMENYGVVKNSVLSTQYSALDKGKDDTRDQRSALSILLSI